MSSVLFYIAENSQNKEEHYEGMGVSKLLTGPLFTSSSTPITLSWSGSQAEPGRIQEIKCARQKYTLLGM